LTPADQALGAVPVCRSCKRPTLVPVVDLGPQPEANSYPARADLADEPRWPLRVLVCERCWLLQLDAAGPAEAALPGPAPYELSSTMRDHADAFVAEVVAGRAGSASPKRVVELASHGAYLQPFLAKRGVDSLIVEGQPALAAAADARGYRVVGRTFGAAASDDLVAEDGPADLVIDNYLLAHVPDPDDFVAGLARLVDPGGVAVLELDHVLPLLVDRRFDSIRHGHFSYFGLTSLADLLGRHGLVVAAASAQPVYGGALRIHARHAAGAVISPSVRAMLDSEALAGLTGRPAYAAFADGVDKVRAELRGFLEARRAAGEVVVGYGAPSRGNTLLNASGITPDLLPFTVDRSPLKHGRYLPGSHIPIHPPERIFETRPDYVLILTWDIQAEVAAQMRAIDAWGGRFVVPIPRLTVLPPA
jgi:SAM-dependent methyltransferase